MRNSSIELFRIMAMLFVVIVHCNGWFVGGIPEKFDETNINLFRISQATIQAFTCTCVNMFLMISGYFGLRLKWKSFLNIYLLLISITIPFYLFNCYLCGEWSIKQFFLRFMAFSRSGYFVECYLLLMFFSPVINAFIEKNRNSIVYWVLTFWAIELYFEFLIHDKDLGFNNGYSFIHFVLIYMIGRTLYLYNGFFFAYCKKLYLFAYFFFILMILTLYLFLDITRFYSYCSPFNILATSSLFIIFAKMSFYNKWINWIASSTFAVYIIHINPPVKNWLKAFDIKTLENNTYPSYLMIMGGVIILIFCGSILYDKIIKMITTPIIHFLEVRINKFNNNSKNRIYNIEK